MNMNLNYPEPVRDPVTHEVIEGAPESDPALHEARSDSPLPGAVTGGLAAAVAGALVGVVLAGPPGAVVAGAIGTMGGVAVAVASERES